MSAYNPMNNPKYVRADVVLENVAAEMVAFSLEMDAPRFMDENAEALAEAVDFALCADVPEAGGARFTVSGGDVLELPDRHLESEYDDRNGDGYDF